MALRLPWLVLATGTLLLTAGCHALGGCSNPDTYAGAQNLPRLKIPVGLDGLDTTQALEIPALTQPAAPPESKDSCLEEPPAMREPGSNSAPIEDEPTVEKAQEPARKRNRPVSPPH